jgi:hypothetical protein
VVRTLSFDPGARRGEILAGRATDDNVRPQLANFRRDRADVSEIGLHGVITYVPVIDIHGALHVVVRPYKFESGAAEAEGHASGPGVQLYHS